MSSRRLTIGFLISYLTEDYEAAIWRGLVKAAEKRGVDLLAVDGGAIDNPYEIHRQKATVYSLICDVSLDGIIVAAGAIGNFADERRMETFLRSLPRVPQILIGKTVGSRPAILVDNGTGMRQAVSHLIEAHGRRRIAFIAGPSTNLEAVQRYQAYREALESHDIDYDPNLVYAGDFDPGDGIRGVEAIWGRPGAKPDALAASTDYIAISAMEELARRGISVPRTVAVTGFDDIEDCVNTQPTVTTVRQPYDAIGEAAIDLVLKAVQGNGHEETVTLPTRMLVRASCGCMIPPVVSETGDEDLGRLSRLRNAIERSVESGEGAPFLETLEAVLREEKGLFPSFGHWFDLLKWLFDSLLEGLSDRTSRRRHMLMGLHAFGLEYLGRKAEELQKANAVHVRDTYIVLNQFYEKSSFTFDPAVFSGDLDEALPRIGITSFLMCLYQDSLERARIEHIYSVPLPIVLTPGACGTPAQLIDSFLASWKRGPDAGSLILLPLYHRSEDLGFILCRAAIPDGALYESLLSQLSNAIKGTALMNEVHSHSRELERKVQERSGELKTALEELERANRRLESISVLDELTGLYNRRGFLACGRQHIDLTKRREGDFILFFVDMDGLKDINDSFGHASGDEALRDMSWLLSKVFRQTDVLARLGGDEFIVLAVDMKPDQEHVVRERLASIVSEFNATSGKPYRLAFSMGCAPWDPARYACLEEMMAEADRQLYEEKKAKKACR
jgi:diguanylate cyclase (GGDEF)-like protein